MEEDQIYDQLEEALDSQDLNYSLSVDADDDYITVAVTYEGNSFPRLGKELDRFLEGDYMIEVGSFKPEPDLPNARSHTFALKPVNQD